MSDFADEADFIRQGTDSKVYLAKDGKHVIKVSFGKPEGKRFRPDIDTTALFNSVFRNTAYEIVGYGEFDGKFARILKQPFVDFADKTALNAEEREEYMRTLGFEPINESKTAFSNGSIVAADLQKSNILKDAAGNISVIDADMKLHTKDVGGNYTYPPVEADLPEGTRFRVTKEEQAIIDKAKSDGTYMKAPNGKPTNLNEKQWVQVRTKAFKKWFGDWEKKPKKSSLMVDENGEPKVFYHGSPNEFNEFLSDKMGMTGTSYGQGFYFSPDKEFAEYYKRETGRLYELFINMRKPLSDTKKTIRRNDIRRLIDDIDKRMKERDDDGIGILDNWNDVETYGRTRVLNEAVEAVDDYNDTDVEIVGDLINTSGSYDTVVESLRETLGYDGIIPSNTDKEIIVHHSNQIKSAISNEGTFDSENNDIRFRFIGERGARNLDNAEEATTRLDNLSVAREMESAEKDAKVIKMATGWERGADGKWRYEVKDRFNVDAIERFVRGAYGKTFGAKVPLERVLKDDDTLLTEYPQLKETSVKFQRLGDSWGVYYPESNEIAINTNFIREEREISDRLERQKELVEQWKKPEESEKIMNMIKVLELNPEEVLKDAEEQLVGIEGELEFFKDQMRERLETTIVHEVQHAIQRIEGFEHGGNVDSAKKEMASLVKELGLPSNTTLGMLKQGFNEGYATAEQVEKANMVAEKRGFKDIESYLNSLNPERFYNNLSGEVEARNAARRSRVMNEEDMREYLASETEDVSREDQIFLNGALEEGTRFRRVYHGSGASFDRFDHSFMGTGEGAQAYGWGTYVTEVNGIARSYADSYNTFKSVVGDFYLRKIREGLDNGKSFQEVKQELLDHHRYLYDKAGGDTSMYGNFISDYQKLMDMEEPPSRYLYEVEIPDFGWGRYLKYDDAFTANQFNKVVKALEEKGYKNELKMNNSQVDWDNIPLRNKMSYWIKTHFDWWTGQGLYKAVSYMLGGDKEASNFLSDLGFVGIQYPANATTGGRADNSKNYVIFNEDDLKIVEHTRFRLSDKGRKIQNEVDKFTEKYNSKETLLLDLEMTDEEIDSVVPELTNDGLKEILENNPGITGGYSSKTDKIYIFVENQALNDLEDTMFHENLHQLLDNEQGLVESFFKVAAPRFPKNIEYLKERGYDDKDIPEELFVRLAAKAMDYGIFDDVVYNLPEDAFERYKELIKEFGYGYRQEIKSRVLGKGRRGTPHLLEGEEIHETRRTGRNIRENNSEEEETAREQAERLGNLFGQVADMGLDGVLGNKAYTSAMVDIYKELPQDVRTSLADDALRHYKGSIAPAVSDYLNHNAEASIWDKVVGIIREALRKVGFDVDLNTNDVKYILWRSQKKLDRNNLLDVAEDIDKKYRLKVGEYNGSPTRFRVKKPQKIDLSDERPAIIKEYDKELKTSGFNFQEAFQDRMLSVKVLMEKIEAETGKKAKKFEDAYEAENQLSSKNKVDQERWLDKYYKPLLEELQKLSDKYGLETVRRYVYCKSGLERNVVLRQRDADAAYNEAKEELDEKLANGDITQAQYDVLLDKAEDQRNKTLSEDIDYSGLRGMLFNVRADELFKQYKEGNITEQEYKQKVNDLKKDKAKVIKDWKDFAEVSVSDLESRATSAEIDALWNKINAATNETLRIDFESGMIDRETYEAEKKMMKYYVPLRNWANTTAEDMYEYRHDMTPAVTSNQKTAKGRESEADNPIATIALMAQNAIVRGNRNKMKMAFYSFVVNRPTALASVRNVWYVRDANNQWQPQYADTSAASSEDEMKQIIEQFENNMEQLEAQGDAFRGRQKIGMNFRASGKQRDEHAVVVMINGKEYAVYVNGNPRAAQAMNGLTNNEAVDDAAKWIDALKRYYGAGLTSWNPDFIIPNLVRDTIHATTMTFLDKGVMASVKYAANVPRMFSHVAKEISGVSTGDPKLHKYFEEFVANGGETGYTAIHTLEDYKKEYDKLMNEAKGLKGSIGKNTKEVIRKISKVLEAANRIAEDVNRFNAYVTSRESGAGVVESVSAAKNITVNFNRKGALNANHTIYGKVASWMSRWILFFNPSVQGIYQLVTKTKENPKRATALGASILASGFFVPMINDILVSMFGDDDDDYWNQSDYKRRNNWMLFVGDGYISVPLPPVLRELYGIGDIMYGVITGHIPAQRAVYDLLKQVQSAVGFVNVIPEVSQEPDMITYVKGFAPDIVAPFMDVISNSNFMGRPIAKWTDYNESEPEYERVYKGVGKQWVELSKFMNELGGNETRRSDWWGNFINPAMMEHLFTSYTGGIGKTINNLAGMAIDAANGDTENMDVFRKTPVLHRFYTPNDEKTVVPSINRKFYEFKYQYDNAKKSLKKSQDGVKSDEHPEWQKYIDEMKKNGEYEFIEYFEKENKKLKKIQNLLKGNPSNKKELEQKEIDKKAEIAAESFRILRGER